jgi:demethylsterigmatocystin 6-O-methyltransferase
MLSCLGGAERTRNEFAVLLHAAGLRIVDVHKYNAQMQSVIMAALL